MKGITVALVAGNGAFLLAQEDAEDEETFELSPFTVDGSNDSGYRAANTLTGSRLNTSLADTAASVSVFTEEFLNDTGLTSMEEVALYSVGSINGIQDTNSSPNINNFLGAANSQRRVRIRGIRGSKGLDYFQSYIPDDAYRTGRYDESRGPNGILFGISEAGGIVNTTPLRASTAKDFGRIRYSGGSNDRNRTEVRYNKVLIEDVLGVYLAGLYQDNGGWRSYQKDEREGLFGAINWKANERLTIQAWGETGDKWGSRQRNWNVSDRFLPWYLNRNKFGLDAVTFVSGNGSTSLGDGSRDGDNPSNSASNLEAIVGVDNNNVSRNAPGGATGRRYVFVENDGSYYNSASQWESEGFEDPNVASLADTLAATSLADLASRGTQGGGNEYRDTPIVLNEEGYAFDSNQYGFEYPTYLNASGPDSYRAEAFSTYAVMADYKLTDKMFLNVAFNHQQNKITAQFDDSSRPEIRGDPNLALRNEEVAGDMGLDPDIPNPWAGQLYIESQWRYQTHTINYDEARAALSYDLDFDDFDKGWLGRHRIAAGYAYRTVEDTLLGTRHAFLGNPFDTGDANDFDDNRNRVYVRNYLTEGDFSTYVQASPLVPGGETTDVITEDGEVRTVGWANENPGTGNARSDIEVKSQILALQNSFWENRIVTTFGFRKDEADNVAYGHVRDPIVGFQITTDPTADGYRVDPTISSTTRTAGIVFKMNDNFSLLANTATSIGLPEFRNIVFPDASIAAPVEGEGYDVGIGFELMEKKLSGRLVYFSGEAINRTSSGGGTRIMSDPMWQTMRALDWVRTDNPGVIRNPDTGLVYSDSEWASELNALNGASGDGVSSAPAGRINSFLQDEFTDGVELSLTANITDNWRVTLNGSYTDRVLQNYGRQFARSAGFQKGDDNRWIQAVGVVGNTAVSVDLDGTLSADGIHTRILQIAQAAQGSIPLINEAGDVIGNKILDPNASAITINDGETEWIGPGALIINTDNGGTYLDSADFNVDETVAFRLWESQDQLQINNDEREKRWGLSPWKTNMFTAYDFTEGKLKGFTAGGGYRYLGATIIGEDAGGNEIKGPSQSYFDLLFRYAQRLENGNRIDYQINVYNLFDRTDALPIRFANIGDPTTPYSRVQLVDPRSIRATVSYSF